MKTLFIEARRKIDGEEISKKQIKNLPPKLHLLYSIQYEDLAKKVKSKLKEVGKEILGFEQILGCSDIDPKGPLLLIGSGEFHSLQLAFRTGKPIYIYDSHSLRKIDKERIGKEKKLRKAKRAKFYSAQKVGVLFSTKQGQKKSPGIIKKLGRDYPKKSFYPFIANNLDLNELTNFPLSIWLNTACPGIEYGNKAVLNYTNLS